MNKNEILDELDDLVEEDIPNFMDSIDVARMELKDQIEKMKERIKSDDD